MIVMWLALSLALLFAQEQAPAKATMSGTVTDAVTGAALGKVRLLAEPIDSDEAAASTITDEKGNFTLVRLDAGAYELSGIRNGYLRTYYGARRVDSKGIAITLTAGMEQRDLQLRLIPFAVVAGTVRDPDGEPLSGARVALIGVSYRGGVRRLQATGQYATTDEAGNYRITSVSPGGYYVHAGPEDEGDDAYIDHSVKGEREEELTPAFHPAAREIDSAQRIEVRVGDRFSGADVTLARSKLYKVRVRFEGPPGLESGVSLEPQPTLLDGTNPHFEPDCKPGVCEFHRVPSGNYLVRAEAAPANRTIKDLMMGGSRVRVSVPVKVTDEDLDNVHLTIGAPVEIAGHVTVADDTHASREYRISFMDAGGNDQRAESDRDGLFTVRMLPGRYTMEVQTADDVVARSIRAEQVDVLQDGLTVGDSRKMSLEVVLAHDGASVDGLIKDKDDKAVSGATVMLVPEEKLRWRTDLYQKASSNQFGRYRLTAVSPGHYKLFVWMDVAEGQWFDPDFLRSEESNGQPVELNAKGKQTMDLRVDGGK